MTLKKSHTSTPVTLSEKFTIDNTWAVDPLISQNDIFACAQHALIGAPTQTLKSLQRSIPQVPAAAHKPVSTGDKSGIVWATWHHGKDFYTYFCGNVTTVLHNASLTDTEREATLLRARKAEAQGALVFATGAKLTHQAPHTLEQNIEHIGLVFTHKA
jgi:hypothetical protein